MATDTSIVQQRQRRRVQAGEEFDQATRRTNGFALCCGLADGLNQIRNGFYARMHTDVEQFWGMDSTLAPISEAKSEVHAKSEIDLYLAVEAAAEVAANDWLANPIDWFLPWLLRLRVGTDQRSDVVASRLERYIGREPRARRLAFAETVERVLPEARHAPLVAYTLLPLSVWVTTAQAFGDHLRANEVRNEQLSILPAIGDCHHCHGRPLENGELCVECGNPFWKFQWLMADA